MSNGERIPLARAQALAAALVTELQPFSEHLVVAGSVRRRRATIGDIELVAIPRTRAGPPLLFGSSRPISLLWEGLEAAIRREATACPDCHSVAGMGHRIGNLLDGGAGACASCANTGMVGRMTVAPPYSTSCKPCSGAGCYRCAHSGAVARAAPWGDRYRKLMWCGVAVDLFTADCDSWGAQVLVRTGPPEYSQAWVEALRPAGYQMRGGWVRDLGQDQIVSVPDEETAHALVGWDLMPPEDRDVARGARIWSSKATIERR